MHRVYTALALLSVTQKEIRQSDHPKALGLGLQRQTPKQLAEQHRKIAQTDMSSRAADGSRRVLEETMASTRVAEKQPIPLGQWQL